MRVKGIKKLYGITFSPSFGKEDRFGNLPQALFLGLGQFPDLAKRPGIDMAIEQQPDLLLAYEARIETGVALVVHIRHFERHVLSGEQVGCFEDGRHAAAADDFGDGKAVIEGLPRLGIVPGRFHYDGGLARMLKRLAFRLQVCLQTRIPATFSRWYGCLPDFPLIFLNAEDRHLSAYEWRRRDGRGISRNGLAPPAHRRFIGEVFPKVDARFRIEEIDFHGNAPGFWNLF